MNGTGVFDVQQGLPFPAESPSARLVSLSAPSVRSALRRAAGAFSVFQVFVVGVVLQMLAGRAGDHAPGLLRVAALALVATVLAAAVERGWRRGSRLTQLGAAAGRADARGGAFAMAAAFALVATCAFAVGGDLAPRMLAAWAVASSAAAALLRLAAPGGRPVAVVGAPRASADLARRLAADRASERVRVAAAVDPTSDEDLERLDRLVAAGAVSTVVISGDAGAQAVAAVCARLADTSARVLLAPPADALPIPPFGMDATRETTRVLLTELLPQPFAGGRAAAKRAFDLLIALALIPALLPVLVAIPLAIKLESRGPVLFRQWRFGQGSRRMRIYKFRTMRADLGDATGAERTLARDPRVTRVGRLLRRLSLDELPQLLNVIRGDMSLVGPRPHATHMKVEGVYYFDAVEAYRLRHRVLPGITGWAQVNGSRGEIDTLDKARRRVALDLWYIANWSPLLDVWIILRTAFGGFATFRAD